MSEKETRDAPSWYSAEEAGAWASGWNEARRSALLEAAEVADRIGSEWEGCEDWSGNQSIEVAAAIRSLADGEEKKG